MLHNLAWENEMKGEKGNRCTNGRGGKDVTVVSLGQCARTAKLVFLSLCTFMTSRVPGCKVTASSPL